MEHQKMIDSILSLGAFRAAVVAVKDIPFEPEFRKMCESNACGMYGKSWMCPPFVGQIDTLIATAQSYTHALVYQTVGKLEDSYDFEGMMDAGKRMNDLTQKIRDTLGDALGANALHLGAGGCRLCEICAKRENLACRFPDRAISSLEAYGISVSHLASICGMKYINGQNTVTYFGTILFD